MSPTGVLSAASDEALGTMEIDRVLLIRRGSAQKTSEQNPVLKAGLSSLQAFSYLMRGRLHEAVQANEHFLQGIDELEGAIWLIAGGLIVSVHLSLACDDAMRLDRFVEVVHRSDLTHFLQPANFSSVISKAALGDTRGE